MVYNLPKLPPREENSNKGTFGKILNVSGSEYMTGAAYLSSVSALRTGAGYVELASHKDVLRAVSTLAPEIVLAPIERIPKILESADVLAIGCGLSTSEDAVELFKNTISQVENIPVVIDADGLNILANNKEILPSRAILLENRFSAKEGKQVQNDKVILTPHPKEASRLLGKTLEEILNNMEISAKDISKKYSCVTVLKSHKTIVTDGIVVYHNTTGNSALAKAGSGDVLTGMISGLLAQKMGIFDAACLGVYLHGLAGDLAKNDLTEYGVLASDTIRYIPYAIKNYLA